MLRPAADKVEEGLLEPASFEEYKMHNRQLLNYYEQAGISEKVFRLGASIEDALADRFRQIDEIAELNQLKVLLAMQKNHVSAEHMNGSTGYGYNDAGRDSRHAGNRGRSDPAPEGTPRILL